MTFFCLDNIPRPQYNLYSDYKTGFKASSRLQ